MEERNIPRAKICQSQIKLEVNQKNKKLRIVVPYLHVINIVHKKV